MMVKKIVFWLCLMCVLWLLWVLRAILSDDGYFLHSFFIVSTHLFSSGGGGEKGQKTDACRTEAQ